MFLYSIPLSPEAVLAGPQPDQKYQNPLIAGFHPCSTPTPCALVPPPPLLPTPLTYTLPSPFLTPLAVT